MDGGLRGGEVKLEAATISSRRCPSSVWDDDKVKGRMRLMEGKIDAFIAEKVAKIDMYIIWCSVSMIKMPPSWGFGGCQSSCVSRR